ncbi:MAG: Sodium/glucose cotransporter [bacterium]|nr:Sodium/glucose cotransporter [bacterium]
MTPRFALLDWTILLVYFVVIAGIGPLFARKNKSTETFFVGNRSFPAWLLGLAMFATSISSITVVAYPADAYKTAYLRLLPAFMLPFGIYIASKVFLPFFRRNQCTSAFEYLEGRFGPGVRLYAACAFLFSQVFRISTILYLVSLVFEQMTGASPYMCILLGGAVIGTYTVLGGIKAIVWTQFIQAFVLWFGAILCLVTVVGRIEGGIATIVTTAWADGKFMLGDLNLASGELEPSPWISLRDKAVVMMFICGLMGWLTEYSSNQNVIQKYVSAKNPKEATRAIWICCLCSVPTWTFFMFLGTSIYVYFKLNPDPRAVAILTGADGAKAESILPYFCVSSIPSGLLGLVIAGILSAAMSASASSVNAISAVGVTDVYRRHMVKGRAERHYVRAARILSAASVLMMMGGATLFLNLSKLTIQDTGAKIASIIGGGLLGLYALGFLTTRGNSRAVGVAIACTILFSSYFAFTELGWVTQEWYMDAWGFSEGFAAWLITPIHTYYVGLFANLILFVVAYFLGGLFERRRKDLTDLTVWTQHITPAPK